MIRRRDWQVIAVLLVVALALVALVALGEWR